MNRPSTLLPIAAALVLGASSAVAAAPTPVVDCIDLGDDHALLRGGARQLYLSTRDQHYRLSFTQGACEAMTQTSKLRLDTDGDGSRLCPGSSRLIAHRASCAISTVEQLDAADFRRLTRAWRR